HTIFSRDWSSDVCSSDLVTRETLLLKNLNCPSCVASLQRALANLKGVRKAEVAFATGTVELVYDEQAVTASDIDRTVASFGAVVDRKSTRLNSSHVKISY